MNKDLPLKARRQRENILKLEEWDERKRPSLGSAYRRYFEGYREEKVQGENGKRSRIQRVYAAEYYRRCCTDAAWYLTKAVYAALYLTAVAVYGFALSRPAACNTVWYVALPGLVSVPVLMLLLAKIAAGIAAGRKMKIYDYKYIFGRIFPYCAVTAGLQCTVAFMMLLFLVLDPQTGLMQAIVPFFGCLVSAALLLSIGIMERKAQYIRLDDPNTPSA